MKTNSNPFHLSIRSYIRRERIETEILLRSIPATVVTLFVVSVICMNLLANKTLIQTYWIAIDGGTLISWLSFMCMDMITKYFGPKASNKIALLASSINLLTCFIFYIASIIPSSAADYTALNSLLGGTWFILLGSTVAFLLSAVIHNFLNWLVGKLLSSDKDEKKVYFLRTTVSTFIGQFSDNLIFSVIVFVIFAPIYWDGFSWTLLQCFSCALTGAAAELIMEILFTPLGYKIIKNWKKHEVGREYLDFINQA